jgi:methylase of polypeptide subunit release factors
MKYEPSRLEILLTKIAFLFYGKSVYRAFANSLPLKGNDRVLDFGCGMGTVAHYTAKMLSRGHLTCLDISERWLNECRKNLRGYGNVTFVQTEFPALENESFDLVYCHFVLGGPILESHCESFSIGILKNKDAALCCGTS